MFWQKKRDAEIELDDEVPEEEIDEEADIEIDETDIDEAEADGEISDEAEAVKEPEAKVSFKPESLDQLAEFANKRGNGNMQFMSKSTGEVFELRDAHFRIAQVWGTVTMARECSAEEYARVMLAIDLREHKDDYYLIPGLTESEIRGAIEDFCEDRFSLNGKKYSKKPERFTKFLKENDCREEWDEYTKALVYDKLEVFCEENGITFDGVIENPDESAEDNDGSDA